MYKINSMAKGLQIDIVLLWQFFELLQTPSSGLPSIVLIILVSSLPSIVLIILVSNVNNLNFPTATPFYVSQTCQY